MAQVCIPKEVTELIKKNIPSKAIRSITALDNTKRNVAIAEILDSFDEKNLFSDKANRLVVEQGIKDKILETQKDALIKAAEYKKKVKTEGRKQSDTLLNKINRLSNLDDITDDLIQEGVEIKLGARLTGDEIKVLVEASENVGTYLDIDGNPNSSAFKTVDDNGKPMFRQPTAEYEKALKNYLQVVNAINPSSVGEKVTSTLNANLLFNLKSPFTNIIANAASFIGFTGETTLKYGTPYKADLAIKNAKDDALFYARTGFDLTRAQDINAGVKSLGENLNAFNTLGKKWYEEFNFDKTIAAYNDVVYNKSLGTPDQAFASAAKNIVIFTEAKNRILKENPDIKIDTPEFDEIFYSVVNDASLFHPKTDLGIELKEIGIAEANRVTFQEQSALATFAATQRASLNQAMKDALPKLGFSEEIAEGFKIGTWAVPFVMTNANAINSGLNYSGLKAAGQAGVTLVKGISKITKPEEAKQIMLDNFSKINWQKPTVGITASLLLASMIPADNYIGNYPTNENEKRLFELGRATTNSIKVGGKWLSLDYLGAGAAPLVGVLEAKKAANATVFDLLTIYAIGSTRQLFKLPGLTATNDLAETIENLTVTLAESINKNNPDGMKELYTESFNALTKFIGSRFVPSIVGDVGESIDKTKRDINTGQYSPYGINLDPLVLKIPGLRESLPVKRDVFGEEIKTEGYSQIFFGARVKTASDDKVVLELQNMANEGVAKTPTDYIGRFAQKYYNIPDDKLNEEKAQYGKLLYEAYNKTIESSKWNSLNLDDKKDALSKAESKVKDKYKNELKKRYGQVKTEE
jgi:hypothetical protein